MSSWERLEDNEELLSDSASGRSPRRPLVITVGALIAVLLLAALTASLILTRGRGQGALHGLHLESTTPFIDPWLEDGPNTTLSWKSLDPPEFAPVFAEVEALLSLFDTTRTNDLSEPVRVTVYYSVLSLTSREFLVHSFFPTLRKLGQLVEPRFVPYGNMNLTSGRMTCEHGHDECEGNLVHACALRVLGSRPGPLLALLSCMLNDLSMSNKAADDLGVKCSTYVGTDWAPIQKCRDDGEGLLELGKYGELTGRLSEDRPLKLPVVKVQGFEGAEVKEDFLGFMCSRALISDPKPSACKN